MGMKLHYRQGAQPRLMECKDMAELIRRMWSDDEGQDLAEYGLLLALVAVVVAAAVIAFRGQIVAVFDSATGVLQGGS